MRTLYYLIVGVLLIVPQLTIAQFSDVMNTETIAITLSPTFPTPGEKVTASLDDYALGINFGTIEWLVDGVVMPQAQNSRTVEMTAGALGTSNTITARLRLSDGTVVEAKAVVSPVYTDIIIEPQTFTPQFYLGRAEPTVGSLVRATALIETGLGIFNPTQYTYLWKLNGTTLSGGNRRGAYQIAYEVPQGRDHVLTLEVFDQAGVLTTKRSVLVATAAVDLTLYEVSALYGFSPLAIKSTLPFFGTALTVRAVPYNLDLRSTTDNTFSEWSQSGRTLATNLDPYEITLERTTTMPGVLTFKLRHREALLQGGEVRTQLQF